MRNRSAFTLPELLIVLSIGGIALGIAVPGFLHALDVLAVRAARETLLADAARTRSLALARGGAELIIDQSGATEIVAAGAVVQRVDLAERFAVTVDIENSSRTRTAIRYDLLGVGRLAGVTVKLQRGNAEAGISFSAYGRPRTW